MAVNKKIIFSIIIILLFVNRVSSIEKLTISTLDLPGHVYVEVVSMIMKEVYLRLGVEIEILKMPPERSLLSADSGTTDGELFRIQGMQNKYTNLIMVNYPVFTDDVVVFYNKVRPENPGWEGIRPYKIYRGYGCYPG